MIEHVWSVLCSNSIIDTNTGNFSLVNILEQLTLSPNVPLPAAIGVFFELVTLWSRGDLEQPTKGNTRIILYTPEGEGKPVGESSIDLTHYRRLRHRAFIQGFEITSAGKYIFSVEFAENNAPNIYKVVATIPLEVRLEEIPQVG